jgi:hypothetical protein
MGLLCSKRSNHAYQQQVEQMSARPGGPNAVSMAQRPDDGNALAGILYGLLIEAGVVALIVLLYWLF